MDDYEEICFMVFETNADFEEGNVLYIGFNRQVAEAVMEQEFNDSCYTKDIALYNVDSEDIVDYRFSENTKRLRAECSH